MKKKFIEIQKFNQAWIWMIGIIPALIVLSTLGDELTKKDKQDFGDLIALSFSFLIITVTFVWIKLIRLETVIDMNGIHIKYKGLFINKKILLMEIKSAEIKTYDPLWEYGGWGIKYSFKRGWCYNVSGDKGILLHLTSGKNIMIGTQLPEEAMQALNSLQIKTA